LSLPRLLSQPEAHLVLMLALTLIPAVGLVLAVRRLRGRARLAAVTGFALLLVPFGFQIVAWIVNAINGDYDWRSMTIGSHNLAPFIPLVFHTLGFALLTFAIFTGRKPMQRDADAG
jgi:hypothetical protein